MMHQQWIGSTLFATVNPKLYMENISQVNPEPGADDSADPKPSIRSQQEDGRNKEWEDRARVNTEVVKEGTRTNVERDFEPEEDKKDSEEKDQSIY
jgi:hypothetical protein